jgi:hypothetical protein
MGFTSTAALEGGVEAWMAAGYPLNARSASRTA